MIGGNPRAPYACWEKAQISLRPASYELELPSHIIGGGSQRSLLTERQLWNTCVYEARGVRPTVVMSPIDNNSPSSHPLITLPTPISVSNGVPLSTWLERG